MVLIDSGGTSRSSLDNRRLLTVLYCSLPAGHDGPWCRLLDSRGQTVAAVPRFGVGLAQERRP